MDGESPHKNLILREVGMEYLNQYNDLLRYVFQVTQQDLEEGGYEEGELERAKRPVLRNASVYGWFNKDDELVSQISIYPCEVNLYGKIIKMGGVTGVGTYPEYSGQGLMVDLIKRALTDMREKQQWISFLYPYSIPYYRRKGWEIISDHMTFVLKDTQLPKPVDVSGHVERLSATDEDVGIAYDIFAHATHGAMLRSKIHWDEYWRWENEDERTAAVYYNAQNQPEGCMFYWIAEDVFHIKEMFYLNQEARKGLWNFISSHFSMIDEVRGNGYTDEAIAFLIEESEIQETIEPYYMARIVDVAHFLEQFPFAGTAEPFHFVIKDPIASWNNGIFSLQWQDETIAIGNEPIGEAVYTDIQTLTTMLMGYKRPTYLAKVDRLKAGRRVLNSLEKIIPNETPYFSDYF